MLNVGFAFLRKFRVLG